MIDKIRWDADQRAYDEGEDTYKLLKPIIKIDEELKDLDQKLLNLNKTYTGKWTVIDKQIVEEIHTEAILQQQAKLREERRKLILSLVPKIEL